MRSLGSGERRLDGSEIKLHNFARVGWVGLRAIMLDEEILLTQVLFNELNVTFITASKAEIVHSVLVHWEVTHSSTVLRGHVSNSSSIGEGKRFYTRSEEFDELANNTALSEHLDASEDEICGSCMLGQFAVKVETNNLRKDHGNCLAKHDSFSLNSTNTPSGDTETIDHSGVRVSADNGVGVEHVVAVEDNTGEILEVDLMDNTRAWRNNLEIVEGLGAPLKELESFPISGELELLVDGSGFRNTSSINLHGVIDDEIDGAERVDLARVASKTVHSVTHGSKINDGGNTGKILQDDSGGTEWDFSIILRGLRPVENRLNVLLFHGKVVAVADSALKEDTDRVREGCDAGISEGWKLVKVVFGASML